MSGAGTGLDVTLINCFVQPVGDCIRGTDEAGLPGIFQALGEAAETLRRGGGVGYDFSRLRPRGAEVPSSRSSAAGPCRFMDLFERCGAALDSGGGSFRIRCCLGAGRLQRRCRVDLRGIKAGGRGSS